MAHRFCCLVAVPGPALAALVLLTCGPLAAAPAPRQYSSRAWQTEDGLPHNSVRTLVQTHDGYLWIGTQNGLARFDGVRFAAMRTGVPEIEGANIVGLPPGGHRPAHAPGRAGDVL